MTTEWTYSWADADRYQMASVLLEGAGYSESDHLGLSIVEKAKAVADYYAEAAARGDIDEVPTWDDGSAVDIYDIVYRFGFDE